LLFKPRKRHDVISVEELKNLKSGMIRVRQELDDHLEAINSNTSEQDIQNSFICEIDNRITKIEERMDEIHFFLKKLVTKADLSVELSKDEQRIFLVLYTHEKFMSTERIGLKALLDIEMVEEALSSMMDKGLPLEREILDGKVYFRMSDEFKLRQAKENLINIDTDVTSQFQNTLLEHFFED